VRSKRIGWRGRSGGEWSEFRGALKRWGERTLDRFGGGDDTTSSFCPAHNSYTTPYPPGDPGPLIRHQYHRRLLHANFTRALPRSLASGWCEDHDGRSRGDGSGRLADSYRSSRQFDVRTYHWSGSRQRSAGGFKVGRFRWSAPRVEG